MTAIRLQNVSKSFGPTVALAPLNLEIRAGELFFLLGPSGCGKSTLLRLIAGLHETDSGHIWFNDRDVTTLPTQKRNAVMCFQSYALWPHMTVRDNVGFGLDVRGISPGEKKNRVDEVLNLVQMEELAGRKPNQLSGGQQQRVALARALAVKPACLLLDEPLSNLDAKLRHQMRGEIRQICKTAGLTTIYVTHDQKEALSVADRIALLRAGKLIQIGTPAELYQRPNSSFVADFLGQANLLPGRVVSRADGQICVETPAGKIRAVSGQTADNVILSIRPEQIRFAADGIAANGANRVVGKNIETNFLGDSSEHVVDVNGQRLRVLSAPPRLHDSKEVMLEFSVEDVVVLASDS